VAQFGLGHGMTRRRALGALGGFAAAAVMDPRSLLAAARPASARPRLAPALLAEDPRHLAWVWQFRHDGTPAQIRDTLAAFGLGVALKTHDGAQWMSRYDPTREAVSGPRRIEELANFFEQGGVPFHAWAVAKGREPKKEAELAADVLGAGARSLFIDLEAHAGFWVGSAADAEQYGEELRRRQPSARLSTSIDPRPWEMDRVPLAEFAAFTDEISPQVYWRAFANSANVRKYRIGGDAVDIEGMTPRFVLAAAMRRLSALGLPIHPIGDGTAPTREAWSEFIDESYASEAQSVSVWRFGVVDEAIWKVLKETPPRLLMYVIQPGDTLSAIAARLNTTVDALVQVNGITNPNVIRVGDVLRAPSGSRVPKAAAAPVTTPAAAAPATTPAAAAPATTPAPAAPVTYIVQPGDTLSEIAERFGTSVDALRAANGISNANALRIGAKLTIPGGAAPASAVAAPTAAPPPAARTYTVEAGDSLTGIAVRFDTTVDALKSANGITNANALRIGDRLTIPGTGGAPPGAPATGAQPRATQSYTVQPGDTLSEIAERVGTTTSALARANGIGDAHLVRIGQTLVIP